MEWIVSLFPVLFPLIGCGVGICLGMLDRYGPQNRVVIDDSIPPRVINLTVRLYY